MKLKKTVTILGIFGVITLFLTGICIVKNITNEYTARNMLTEDKVISYIPTLKEVVGQGNETEKQKENKAGLKRVTLQKNTDTSLIAVPNRAAFIASIEGATETKAFKSALYLILALFLTIWFGIIVLIIPSVILARNTVESKTIPIFNLTMGCLEIILLIASAYIYPANIKYLAESEKIQTVYCTHAFTETILVKGVPQKYVVFNMQTLLDLMNTYDMKQLDYIQLGANKYYLTEEITISDNTREINFEVQPY